MEQSREAVRDNGPDGLVDTEAEGGGVRQCTPHGELKQHSHELNMGSLASHDVCLARNGTESEYEEHAWRCGYVLYLDDLEHGLGGGCARVGEEEGAWESMDLGHELRRSCGGRGGEGEGGECSRYRGNK